MYWQQGTNTRQLLSNTGVFISGYACAFPLPYITCCKHKYHSSPKKKRTRDTTNDNISTRRNKERKQKQAEKDRRITVMLICTRVAFFVLLIPSYIARIISLRSYIWKLNCWIFFYITISNHAINMFIYCLTGNKFRSELVSKVASRLAKHVKCLSICSDIDNRMHSVDSTGISDSNEQCSSSVWKYNLTKHWLHLSIHFL